MNTGDLDDRPPNDLSRICQNTVRLHIPDPASGIQSKVELVAEFLNHPLAPSWTLRRHMAFLS